jgi:Uncharacterised protein family (UPF0175)
MVWVVECMRTFALSRLWRREAGFTGPYEGEPEQKGTMAMKRFEIDLPDEVLAGFGWQEMEVPRKIREALIMELLRRDQLSEAQAGALLTLDRWEFLDLMGPYRVPAIRLHPEELANELR